jgi:hypothetical protein
VGEKGVVNTVLSRSNNLSWPLKAVTKSMACSGYPKGSNRARARGRVNSIKTELKRVGGTELEICSSRRF